MSPRSTALLERLTPRERALVGGLVLVFFVMATLVLLVLRSSALASARDEAATIERALDAVYARGPVFQQKLARKAAREAAITDKPVGFSSLLERAATTADGVKITNQEEQPPVDLGDGFVRRSVKFELRGVTMEQLTKFLAAVESEPGAIIFTQRLLVRSPSATEDRLNVDLEVMSWERSAGDGEGEG